MSSKELCNPRPFLKWAGGKSCFITELLKHSPDKFNNYFEPFIGGGALFFALKPKSTYLSDINEDLINTYKQIKNNLNQVMLILEACNYDKESYYKIRNKSSENKIFKAAKFIYLNKTCWNGLYRVNLRGQFNVPFGRHKNPIICDKGNLLAVNRALRNVTIKNGSFERILKDAKRGDFVFLDPPYVTGHKNNGFIEYNSRLFSWSDQERLANLANRLVQKGVKVLATNAEHKSILKLYKNFEKIKLHRRSTIAGKVSARRKTVEMLFRGGY